MVLDLVYPISSQVRLESNVKCLLSCEHALRGALAARRAKEGELTIKQCNPDITNGQGTCRMCSLHQGFVISRFFFTYFTISGGKEYRSLYRGRRQTILWFVKLRSTVRLWNLNSIPFPYGFPSTELSDFRQ